MFVCLREKRKTETVCTLKSMPTVEIKLPARKAPSLNRTSRHVFPTPESPTSITWDTDKEISWKPHIPLSLTHTLRALHQWKIANKMLREQWEPSSFPCSCQTKLPVPILCWVSCVTGRQLDQNDKHRTQSSGCGTLWQENTSYMTWSSITVKGGKQNLWHSPPKHENISQ